MTLATILIAADEPQFRRVLRTTLASEGYFVVEATCGDDALLRLRDSRPDLILLDPSTSGIRDWDACREMRVASDAPLIMLSTRNSEWEKVLVLNAGADDYLIKPFGVQELQARIRAVLRRAGATEHPPTFESRELKIDFERRTVFVRGERIRLTPKEFRAIALSRSEPREITPAPQAPPGHLGTRLWQRNGISSSFRLSAPKED